MMTDGTIAIQLSGTLRPGAASGGAAGSAASFHESYLRAMAQFGGAAAAQPPAVNALNWLNPLFDLNNGSTRLAAQSGQAAAQTELKLSDMMMLTMRSQEFLFNCQLVANIANRSSDGVQQLFRQQS